jgi:hypothetical protein
MVETQSAYPRFHHDLRGNIGRRIVGSLGDPPCDSVPHRLVVTGTTPVGSLACIQGCVRARSRQKYG